MPRLRAALKLADALGEDGEFWICLQGRFDVAKALRAVSEAEVAASSHEPSPRGR